MHFSLKTGFLALIAVMLLGCAATGQNLDRKITLNLKNVTMGEALRQISQTSGVMFSYSPQVIPVQTKVTVKARNKSVRQVLDGLFKDTDIRYSEVENQVILKVQKNKEADKPADQSGLSAKKKTCVISGVLKDKAAGEILIGANVYVKGTTLGTTTNAYGFYSLSLPEGPVHLVFSYIGYQPVEMDLEVKENLKLSFELEPAKMEIQEVEIQAESKEEALQNGRLNIARIQPQLLEQMPGVAGDIDIIKSLQAIPGIKSFGDGSSMFYSRGGKSDQNLILVDEAPIYNPAHLFGFVSALAPEAIKEISVYKGDAPAHLGGRLSSAVDVRTRDGNLKRFGFAGNVGLFVSDLAFEGPFARDKASWMITGRLSNLNWLFANRWSSRTLKMNFYDLNAKLNFLINKNNRVFLSFFNGRDLFTRVSSVSSRTFGISWRNLMGTLRWTHVFNDRLFFNTTLYFSRYNYYLYLDKESGNVWQSSIQQAGLKADFTWYLNPANTLRAGFELCPVQSDPGNVYLSDEALRPYALKTSTYHSAQYIIYVSNEQNPSKYFNLKYGIRLPVWQDFASDPQFIFDENHLVTDTLDALNHKAYATFIRPEPRVTASYFPGTGKVLRLTWARSTQFMQLLNNSLSPFTSLEPWVPAGPNIKPQRSDLLSLAWLHSFHQSAYLFSAEGYYRWFKNTVDYRDHANLLYNPLLEGELRFGKSWTWGCEVMLRKISGKLTGWVAYTWSRAFTEIDDLNEGRAYPANFDTPHEVSVNLNWEPGKHWMLTANWIYHTGSPVSKPTAFYTYNGSLVPWYGEKNNDRLPDYHRLDLSVVYKISKPERKYQHSLSLNIFNVYARKNPFSLNYNKIIGENGDFVVPTDVSSDAVHVPTAISAAGIIPSLNYKFRF